MVHRYILRHVFLATAMAVGLFVFVLIVGNAIRDVIDLLASGRLSWTAFIYLMVIMIPRVIPYALPLGILTGVLLVLGRLSANNEILALKAAGLSTYRIVAPIFLLAIMGTLLASVISLYYAPIATAKSKEIIHRLAQESPERFIKPKTFIKDFPEIILYFEKFDGNALKGFYIWELSEDNKVTSFIKAESGYFNYDSQGQAIVLTVKNAVAEKRKTSDLEDFKNNALLVPSTAEATFRLSLAQFLGENQKSQRLADLTFRELLELREGYASKNDKKASHQKIGVQLAIQKKLVIAFSVISLCSIAIPLGIKASRSETYANLVIALILALTYFVIYTMLNWLEKSPELRPDILIWLPNIAFQGLGFWLLKRTNQH